jgi:uncharacterized membrane protein
MRTAPRTEFQPHIKTLRKAKPKGEAIEYSCCPSQDLLMYSQSAPKASLEHLQDLERINICSVEGLAPMPHHTPLHWVNLGIHIAFGTAALVLGLVAICSSKGGRLHVRSGRLFLYAYLIVVLTAAIGLLAFDFRSFLAVVTLLSFYDVFSGYRALQLKGRRPETVDRIVSVIGALTPWLFITIMRYLHQPWSPVLTWSILGGLVAMSGYDLLRNVLPLTWLKRVWVQEHLVKMMSAYIAITSAFAGTVFPRYMPWAAIIPSILGSAVSCGFLLVGSRAWKPSNRKVLVP